MWEWIVNLGRVDLLSKDMNELCSYIVCAEHFEMHYFLNEQRRKLVHNAVPTIFNHYSHDGDVPLILETLNRIQNEAAALDGCDEHIQEPAQCSQKFPEETKSLAVNSQRGATKSYKCQLCNEIFLSAHELFSHELKNHEHVGTSQTNQIKKPSLQMRGQCEEIFSSKNGVYQTEIHDRNPRAEALNMRNSHKEQTGICNMGQEQDGNEQAEQKPEEQYRCRLCTEIFSSLSDSLQHEIKHGREVDANTDNVNSKQDTTEEHISVYMCHLCKKIFSSETDVSMHEIRKHGSVTSDQNVYVVSEELFTSGSDSQDHNKEPEFLQQGDDYFESSISKKEEGSASETIKFPERMTSSTSQETPLPYKCHTCGKSFETKCHLFYHDLEVHVGITKPGNVQSTTSNEGGMKRIAKRTLEQKPMKVKVKEKQKVDAPKAKQLTIKKIWKADARDRIIEKIIMKERIIKGKGMKTKVEGEKLHEHIQKNIEVFTGKSPWKEKSDEIGGENKVVVQSGQTQQRTFVIIKKGSQSGEGNQKVSLDVITNYVLSQSQVKQFLMNDGDWYKELCKTI
ncbi:zinc finger protein 836-like isoform X2 [Zootermopsis nevadensis]|nr:zinc finger protein 836-like isoform X2 [Zootermopsis nevadensis]XP_021916513.1 zinc finger protein 836-like isoform X2 [Zootermopsis nevadensis]